MILDPASLTAEDLDALALLTSLDDAALDRELVAREGFAEFVRTAWHRVESSPLVWNWHLDALCEHLTALHLRQIRDLVINVPPGMSKSLVASVLFPAWVWTLDPTHRWITTSYAEKIVLRDARKHRTLVTSDWYRARWPEVQIPADATASTAVSEFYTTRGGMRYSATTRQPVTGSHADTVGVDDPIDPQGAAASSGVELEAVDEWWNGTMPTRFRDHRTSARYLIMQRVHERDLTRLFERAGATVLCLPMRFEAGHPRRWARDPRAEGELLCEVRVPEDAVQRMESQLGPSRAAAQLQQRPAPATGVIFQRAWLQRYWVVIPTGGLWTISVDCTFKDTEGTDLVCIQVWLRVGGLFYLIDQDCERRDFVSTCKALIAMAKRWPKASRKLVEDKANGPAVMSALKGKVTGLTPVTPEGGKIARAMAAQPLFEAGNVLLPHPTLAEYADGRRGAPWVRGNALPDAVPEAPQGTYEHQMVTFPKADHDDMTDTTTQYLTREAPRQAGDMDAALKDFLGGLGDETADPPREDDAWG